MKLSIKTSLLLLFVPLWMIAQTVTGKVTDSNTGQPVLGATVVVKDTSNGTATNFDGEYTLTNVPDGAVIIYSYLGYLTQEITYTGQSTLDVILAENPSELDAIVIIGFGTTTQRNVTAAQTTVKSEEFNKGAIVSPGQLLAGKAAGVQVVAASGSPGDGPQIRVRAGSTLSAGQDPLYVVDGIPLDQRNANLNTINPDDIDTITILKDASATAIYGNRASNGVVIITTKKGKYNQEFTAGYDVRFAWNTPVDLVDVFTGDEFRALINERGDADDIALLGDANTDWQNEIYQTGTRAIHNITLAKGYENTALRATVGYTNEEGTLRTSGYERAIINANAIQRALNGDLKLTLNVQGAIEEVRSADTGAIGSAIDFDPTQPIFDENGPNSFFEYTGLNLAPRNPLGLLNSLNNETDNNQIRTTLTAEYKIPGVDGLTATGTGGIDYNEFDQASVRLADSGVGLTTNALRFNSEGIRLNQFVNGQLDYKRRIEALDTDVELLFGANFQRFRRSGSNRGQDNATGLFNDPIEFFNENRLASFIGRATFDIKNTFVISGNVSRNGTSRFSRDNRWGTFGGVSLGIKLTNKDFIQNSSFLSRLKLRGGYGITGQQDIGDDFLFLQTFTPGQDQASVQLGGVFINTIRPQRSVDLTWEETAQYNAGIDFGFFDDVLTGSIDGYFRETTDLLQDGNLPAGSLGNRGLQNIGSTESRGLELGLTARIINTENINWTVSGNATLQELEITNLALGDNDQPIPQTPVEGAGINNFIQEWAVGSDPSSFWVFRQVYDNDGNPLDGVFVDVNGDNVINDEDRVRFKKANPDVYFGLTSNFNYKDLDLSFTFRGAAGGYNYNNVDAARANLDAVTENAQDFLNNSTTNLLETGFVSTPNKLFSSEYIQKSDFVKLDNISLGYTFRGDVTTVRASITGTNLLVITDYDGIDPEVRNGIDSNLFPRNRGIILGLGVQF